MKKSWLLLLIWICVSFGGANASSFFTACVLSKLRLNWWQTETARATGRHRGGARDSWAANQVARIGRDAKRLGYRAARGGLMLQSKLQRTKNMRGKYPESPAAAHGWRCFVHNPFNFAPWHAVIMWMLNKGILGGGQVTTLMKWPHRRFRY